MVERYGDTIVVVAVHTTDPLEPASASGMIGAWSGMAPSALINREYDTILGTQLFGTEYWEEVIARQIKSPAPCNVHLMYSYNEFSREIVATVTATFTDDYIGDGRLNLYIVEDSVVGESQSNYLSGNPDFMNTPFYSLPEHITNFAHQHVLREMVGESYGIDGIIPDTVTAGQQFQHTFNYTIPADYNLEHLHVIGVAQQYKGLKKYRKILNSTHSKFNTGGVGLNEYAPVSDLIISPNPASSNVQIKLRNRDLIQCIRIYQLNGTQVFQNLARNRVMHINTQAFSDGCYIIVVETDRNTYHRKILISK